ncbi:hypothetical protein IJT17_00210, partial [bacterium]|nr:hypothetical protein [bacterium]
LKTMGTDLILCRNVLIYFDRELVGRIIAHFSRCLSPNGWLILAPTEVPLEPPRGLQTLILPNNLLVLRPAAAKSIAIGVSPSDLDRLAEHSSTNATLSAARPHASSSEADEYAQRRLSAQPAVPMHASPSGRLLSASVAVPASAAPDHNASGSSATQPLQELSQPTEAESSSEADSDEQNYHDKYVQAKSEADRGMYHEALATANKYTKLAPTDPRGWLLLALIQEELRLYNKASESLKRATYLDSSLAVAYLFHARVQYRLGQSDITVPLSYFRKITENMPPEEVLPEGDGITVQEARVLADRIAQLSQQAHS